MQKKLSCGRAAHTVAEAAGTEAGTEAAGTAAGTEAAGTAGTAEHLAEHLAAGTAGTEPRRCDQVLEDQDQLHQG